MIPKRSTSKAELDEVVSCWIRSPKGTGYYEEKSLLMFLTIFTPDEIKAAMYIAKSEERKGSDGYFRYLCGILTNWKKAKEAMGNVGEGA